MKNTNKMVHLGLHKTGSTVLQALWATAGQTSLSKEFSIKTAWRLRDVIWGHTDEDFRFPDDVPVFDGAGTDENAFQIFSAENLSNPSLDGFMPERANLYHQYAPEIFAQLTDGAAAVLVVVREPISWLRSMYKQHVHEGGSMTFQGYLVRYAAPLAYELSLTPVLQGWQAQFGADNLLVVPYELMNDDLDRFIAILSKKTGMPPVKFNADVRLNVSVGDHEAEFMRLQARLMKLLRTNLEMTPELRETLDKSTEVISRVVRNQLQNKPDAKLKRLAAKLDLKLNMNYRLPVEIRAAIEEGFFPMLERHKATMGNYTARYRKVFAQLD